MKCFIRSTGWSYVPLEKLYTYCRSLGFCVPKRRQMVTSFHLDCLQLKSITIYLSNFRTGHHTSVSNATFWGGSGLGYVSLMSYSIDGTGLIRWIWLFVEKYIPYVLYCLGRTEVTYWKYVAVSLVDVVMVKDQAIQFIRAILYTIYWLFCIKSFVSHSTFSNTVMTLYQMKYAGVFKTDCTFQ